MKSKSTVLVALATVTLVGLVKPASAQVPDRARVQQALRAALPKATCEALTEFDRCAVGNVLAFSYRTPRQNRVLFDLGIFNDPARFTSESMGRVYGSIVELYGFYGGAARIEKLYADCLAAPSKPQSEKANGLVMVLSCDGVVSLIIAKDLSF